MRHRLYLSSSQPSTFSLPVRAEFVFFSCSLAWLGRVCMCGKSQINCEWVPFHIIMKQKKHFNFWRCENRKDAYSALNFSFGWYHICGVDCGYEKSEKENRKRHPTQTYTRRMNKKKKRTHTHMEAEWMSQVWIQGFALLARNSNDIFAHYTPCNRRSLICFFYLLLSNHRHHHHYRNCVSVCANVHFYCAMAETSK